MDYFDIHSHLYFPDYDTDREEVISRMKNEGIYTTCIGTDIESSKKAVLLADKYENLYAIVGVHPDEHGTENKNLEEELESLIVKSKVVGIGECGFDFFRTKTEDLSEVKNKQRNIFERQINLALKHNKGLMLHGRPSKGTQDAYEEMLDVLESYFKQNGEKLYGNAHFFAGDIVTLKRFLDIGFTVSFTGVITFARDYDEVLSFAPMDMIHAETDAPFVAPSLYRGKRNSPEYVVEIASKMAEIRKEDILVLKKQLILNAKRLFKIT